MEKIKEFFINNWQHIAIIAGFVVISALYFSPVLEGKSLPQSDNTHAIGAAQELKSYSEANGEVCQWTDSMFGGMPGYQIMGDNSSNIFRTFNRITRLGLPYTTIAILFLYLVSFYLLMISLKAEKNLALLGAIAFAFGSYNIIIIAAGHITKAYAIALCPVVLAGVMMIFNERKIVGGTIAMVALGMQLAYNHVQITYYLALTIGVFVVAKFIYAIMEKKLPDFGKCFGILCLATILGAIPGIVNLWTTYEYGQYSIRGASEIQTADSHINTGLDKDYALSWSYGVHETPTLLIPNAVGGVSQRISADNKGLSSFPPELSEYISQQMPEYWGGRMFTSGPVYVGAIICFLFFIGCFYYKGKEKWWLIAATILSIFLAWGKNFPLLTDFMFYHFPLYNKFRTVEMALVIASITMPMLALLGMKEIYDNPERIRYETSKFFGAIGLTAGVAFIFAVAPTSIYSFLTDDEAYQFTQAKMQDTSGSFALLEQALIAARASLTSADAWRSVVLIILASSALWFYSVGKLTDKITIATLIVLVAIDLWSVDKRYLSADNFVGKQEARQTFRMSNADKFILADKEPHRVMSVYTNPFNEVFTSYFHQSVGGYHGAKLRRYQDFIDRYLYGEWHSVTQALRAQDYDAIDSVLRTAEGLKIMNTKYLIYHPDAQPILNRNAYGSAWFVDEVQYAGSPDEALNSLKDNDLSRVAVVETEGLKSSVDSTARITRTSYSPNRLTYDYSTVVDRLAVFSEIYYPAGWRAFVDGEEVQIERADYILRGLQLPAGDHKIEFRFEPQSYRVGRVIAYIFSALAVLIICGAIFFSFRRCDNLPVEK